jgi:small-conductance mechanosensitive channel
MDENTTTTILNVTTTTLAETKQSIQIQAIDFIWLIVAIILSFLVGKITYILLSKYIKVLTKRTKTTLDDKILKAISGPIPLLITVIGVYIAFNIIPSFAGHVPLITFFFHQAMILVAAYTIMKVGDALIEWYVEEIAPKSKLMLTDFLPLIKNVFNAFVIIIALIMILDKLGIKVDALIASLGIAGLAVALALQETLSNFFAGIYMSADRLNRPGDYIKLQSGEEGYVTKIGWRSTQMRTLDNNLVVIPNNKLSQTIVTNYAYPSPEMNIVINTSVSYDSDLEKVEKVTREVAYEVQSLVEDKEDFAPLIQFTKFADSGIELRIVLKVKQFTEQPGLKHELIKKLQARYRAEGIEIPYPKRDVYIKEGKS